MTSDAALCPISDIMSFWTAGISQPPDRRGSALPAQERTCTCVSVTMRRLQRVCHEGNACRALRRSSSRSSSSITWVWLAATLEI